jgi:hypothetical protein
VPPWVFGCTQAGPPPSTQRAFCLRRVSRQVFYNQPRPAHHPRCPAIHVFTQHSIQLHSAEHSDEQKCPAAKPVGPPGAARHVALVSGYLSRRSPPRAQWCERSLTCIHEILCTVPSNWGKSGDGASGACNAGPENRATEDRGSDSALRSMYLIFLLRRPAHTAGMRARARSVDVRELASLACCLLWRWEGASVGESLTNGQE